MNQILSVLLISLAIGLTSLGSADEGARPKNLPSAAPRMITAGKYEFPHTNHWVISEDEKALYYERAHGYGNEDEIRGFDRSTHADETVAFVPECILSMCISRSSRYLVVYCDDSSAFLISRSDPASGFKRQRLPGWWAGVAFSSDENWVFGRPYYDKHGIQAVSIASVVAPRIRFGASAERRSFQPRPPAKSMPDYRIFLFLLVDAAGDAEDIGPLDLMGQDDVSFGPLHEDWTFDTDQPIMLEGNDAKKAAKRNRWPLRTPPGQSEPVKWRANSRVMWAQAIGDFAIWAQSNDGSDSGPLILRRYERRLEKDR